MSDELPDDLAKPAGPLDGLLGLMLGSTLSNWVHGEELQEGEPELFEQLGWLRRREADEPVLTRAGERIVAAFLKRETGGRRVCWTGGDGPEGHEPGHGRDGRRARPGFQRPG